MRARLRQPWVDFYRGGSRRREYENDPWMKVDGKWLCVPTHRSTVKQDFIESLAARVRCACGRSRRIANPLRIARFFGDAAQNQRYCRKRRSCTICRRDPKTGPSTRFLATDSACRFKIPRAEIQPVSARLRHCMDGRARPFLRSVPWRTSPISGLVESATLIGTIRSRCGERMALSI